MRHTRIQAIIFFGILALISFFPLFMQNQFLPTQLANLTRLSPVETLALYLAQQLQQPLTIVYPAVLSVITLLITLTAYDLGAEWRSEKVGYSLSIASLLGLMGLYWLLDTAYHWSIIGLFALACVTYLIRLWRHQKTLDFFGMLITLLIITLTLLQ